MTKYCLALALKDDLNLIAEYEYWHKAENGLPEIKKTRSNLMSSRNATRDDFEHVIASIKSGHINPANDITHRVSFDAVKSDFKSWLDSKNNVIKAMVEV